MKGYSVFIKVETTTRVYNNVYLWSLGDARITHMVLRSIEIAHAACWLFK
jgi:hypothetical protein